VAGGRGWLGDTPGFNGDLNAVLRSIKARTMFVLSPQDQLFPPQYVDDYIQPMKDARVVWIESPAGHLIFGNADPNATRRMGDAIRGFLHELSNRAAAGEGGN
jgi:homoserine O-acetyltransferase